MGGGTSSSSGLGSDIFGNIKINKPTLKLGLFDDDNEDDEVVADVEAKKAVTEKVDIFNRKPSILGLFDDIPSKKEKKEEEEIEQEKEKKKKYQLEKKKKKKKKKK